MKDWREIARRLNHNQRVVILDLNGNSPVMLGCIETVAFRLCHPSKSGRRPALAQHHGDGTFTLTGDGVLVQCALDVLQS